MAVGSDDGDGAGFIGILVVLLLARTGCEFLVVCGGKGHEDVVEPI